MNKREFLKTLTGAALAGAAPRVSAEETPAANPTSNSPQKNWLWMRPGRRSDDQWKAIFDRLREVGFHAVLPEVYNGNSAHFDHPHPDFASQSRLLEQMIPLAHAAGLELHAWMWTMPCTNPRIVANHPDWYAVNGLGESARDKPAYVGYYKFLCPRRAPVQDFIEGNVAALAQIDGLDGVHLDYVRLPDVILAEGLWEKYNIVQDREFPQYDYCYCDTCRAEFKQQSGIDPLTDLQDPAANDEWRQFRQDGVSNLVNGRLAPKAREHGKQITAAVFPNWWNVRQEWHTWDLDGFLPMLYHSFYLKDVEWIGAQVRAALERMDHAKPVYSGLYLPSLPPAKLAAAIDTSRAQGAAGIALFSRGALGDGHFEILRDKFSTAN